MKFAFIQAEKASKPPAGSVSQLCRALLVSRAGYYAWCSRPESQRAKEDALLAIKVAEAHALSQKRYGSPRVQDALKEEGFAVSRKRVIRLMQEQGLVGRPKRMFVATTDSEHKLEVAPNLLKRDFKASAPNQRWVGDITFLRTPEGWLYLAVIIDLYSRYVVGWAVSPVIDRHLVVAALEMALKRRGGGVRLFHSDRGSQYASDDYQKALVARGITCSMSRKGNCWDNAVAESWFSTLTFELGKRFASHDDAWRQLFEYIEGFYNQRRIHTTIGRISPAEFERRHHAKKAAARDETWPTRSSRQSPAKSTAAFGPGTTNSIRGWSRVPPN